jgi:PIN domain nuclease of toxin-antitoxin system
VIVADTHAWLWWLTEREVLSSRALEALNNDVVAISPVTFVEVATLARKQRITLHKPIVEWLQDSLERSSTQVVELTLSIGALAGSLETELVRDPADRVIIATALHAQVPLVTKDHKIIAAGVVATIW